MRLKKLGLSGNLVACCMISYSVLGGLVTVIEHGKLLSYCDIVKRRGIHGEKGQRIAEPMQKT